MRRLSELKTAHNKGLIGLSDRLDAIGVQSDERIRGVEEEIKRVQRSLSDLQTLMQTLVDEHMARAKGQVQSARRLYEEVKSRLGQAINPEHLNILAAINTAAEASDGQGGLGSGARQLHAEIVSERSDIGSYVETYEHVFRCEVMLRSLQEAVEGGPIDLARVTTSVESLLTELRACEERVSGGFAFDIARMEAIRARLMKELDVAFVQAVIAPASTESSSVLKAVKEALQRMGLVPIEIQIGKTPADPLYHEFTSNDSSGKYPPRVVANVIAMGLIDMMSRQTVTKAKVVISS